MNWMQRGGLIHGGSDEDVDMIRHDDEGMKRVAALIVVAE